MLGSLITRYSRIVSKILILGVGKFLGDSSSNRQSHIFNSMYRIYQTRLRTDKTRFHNIVQTFVTVNILLLLTDIRKGFEFFDKMLYKHAPIFLGTAELIRVTN